MKSIERRRVRGPIVPALVLIAIGTAFFLTENHIIRSYDLWKLWPVILILAGAGKAYSHPQGRRVEGWVLIIIGSLFLVWTFGYLQLPPFQLWPLALIALGLFLLWRALSYNASRRNEGGVGRENLVIFGGADVIFGGEEFEGTAMTVVFGGYNLDLRNATMRGGRAEVEATAVFGGIELRVPPTWNVVIQGFPLFGGYSDETTHPASASEAPQLIVNGSAVFGGVNIKN
jgi:hypothetical protein